MTFEVLERVTLMFSITGFHVLHNGLFTAVRGRSLLLVCHVVKHAVVVNVLGDGSVGAWSSPTTRLVSEEC